MTTEELARVLEGAIPYYSQAYSEAAARLRELEAENKHLRALLESKNERGQSDDD